MLVVKAALLIYFLCVGFSQNWLNADKGQNCEKVYRSIPSIFRLPVVVCIYCYLGKSKQVPPQFKLKNLLLILLCGDVAVNPGPTNFGFVNCRSIRNKGPLLHYLIQGGDLDILGLVETHIRPTDTDGLLNSPTPANYNLIQKPRCTGVGGGVSFLCRKSFSPSIVSSLVFRSFEIIILSFRSDYNSFVAACVYRSPGSCTTQFLEDFLALSGFLSSSGSNFIICGDINVHQDVECGDRSRFNDILQCCSLSQCVSGPAHILGHTLNILISPCNSDFVRNVSVGDFISDHAAIRCQLDFSHPTTCIEKMVSYCRYHRIDIDQFRNDLSNIPFVLSPEGTAAELYDQYMVGITQVLDKHAPIISRMTKQQSDEWLSDSYHIARCLRRQFERMWRKHKTQLNRSRLRKQITWCNRLANKDKGSYNTNLITANSEDPKKLWQSLKKVLHRTSETVLPAHSSEKSLVDTFASFKIRDTFSTSGSFNDAPDSLPPAFNIFKPVTEDEVSKCINESHSKSCPLDPIPTFLLKDCLDILLPSITKLVNYSLIDGSFPSAFKRAVVTRHIKKVSLPRNDLKNYRRVSGLCFLSKLVERVVAKQLTSHINNHKLDNPH